MSTMQKQNDLNGPNGLSFDLGVKCDPSFDQLCEIHPSSSDTHWNRLNAIKQGNLSYCLSNYFIKLYNECFKILFSTIFYFHKPTKILKLSWLQVCAAGCNANVEQAWTRTLLVKPQQHFKMFNLELENDIFTWPDPSDGRQAT